MARNAAPIYPGADPLSETRAIHLGPGTALAEHCGTELLRLDVATPAEAVRAIMLEHPGARQIIEAGQWMIRDGDHLAGGDWDLVAERGRSDIYILPAGEGANEGVGKIFAGLALAIFGFVTGGWGLGAGFTIFGLATSTYVGLGAALALSGLARVMSPTPHANPMDREASDVRRSGMFSNPSTLTEPGEPVPIVYGSPMTGALRLSYLTEHVFNVASDWDTTLGIFSTEGVRIVDLVSEGEVSGPQSGEGSVYVLGGGTEPEPMSTEPGLALEFKAGAASNVTTVPHYRPRVISRPVLAAAPVVFPVDDPTVDRTIFSLHWQGLYTGSTTVAPTSRKVEYRIEYAYQSNPTFWIDWIGPTTVKAWATTDFLTGFGNCGYLTPPSGGGGWQTIHVPGLSAAGTSGSFWSTDGFKMRFRVAVIWDSAGPFPYPGTPQAFDIHWATPADGTLASPANGTPQGPWQTKEFQVEETETLAGTESFGISEWLELSPEELSDWAGANDAWRNGFMFGVDAKSVAQRPKWIAVFQSGGRDSGKDYGSSQEWHGNDSGIGEVDAYSSGPFALDLSVSDTLNPISPPINIRITRLTPDLASNSLSRDEFRLGSITEAIDHPAGVDYADTALAIITGSTGVFAGQISNLNYNIQGLKVSVPNGYDPVAGTFTSPWNGAFQASKLYSNDPAWILWDLLTSDRFGLSIAPARIDKWSFGVASRRNLTLVPDLVTDGSTERRYIWNGAISAGEDGYKVASQIAASMDSQLWISTQGLIYLGQDAPQTEISRLITQANVIAGIFTYEGSSVDARRNISEVTYRDSRDGFRASTERADRQFSIERYGETAIETDLPGVTSTGQAIRAARRILITDESENQTVRFQIGLENSGIQPGDLIEIADASRSQTQNGSRISTTFGVGGTLYLGVAGPTDWATIGVANVSRVRWLTTNGTIGDGNLALVWNPTLIIVNGTPDWALPVAEGAPVMLSTSTPETWRVLEVADDGEGLYTVLAVQHDATKWAAIDDPTDLGTAYTFPGDVWPPPGFPS